MYQVYCKTIKIRKWQEYSRPFETELEAFNCLQKAVNRRTVSTDDHFIMYIVKEVKP